MTIRGIQLRAVLIPVGVAVFSIAALAWYGFVYIPSQQRYLNERNIRLLRILAEQVGSKINNFDQALDNALKSFTINGHDIKGGGAADIKKLGQYLESFLPELTVLDKT